MDNFTPCPRTVQLCIDAVGPTDYTIACSNIPELAKEGERRTIKKRLRNLLPKPDPAKALVDEYLSKDMEEPDYTFNSFARWLIETGRIHLPKGDE